MKSLLKFLLINSCVYLELLQAVGSVSESFFYEKMHNFGLGRRVIENYRRLNMMSNRNEYPDPLPPAKPRLSAMVPSPYHSIYQGRRKPNDSRVFRRRFDYKALSSGHQAICEGMFNCKISHLAVETVGGIPILLRGGAGYNHFVVVVRAKPGAELKGSVRAYCLNNQDRYYAENYGKNI